MNLVLLFVILTVAAFAMDMVWLDYVAKSFYLEAFKGFGRISADGRFEPVLWSAALVYVIIPLAVVVFVLQPSNGASFVATVAKGALLGFCLYGVYDFTNHSTIRGWTIGTSLLDAAWGTFLCASLAALGKFLLDRSATGT